VSNEGEKGEALLDNIRWLVWLDNCGEGRVQKKSAKRNKISWVGSDEEMKYCKNCDKTYNDNYVTCGRCGGLLLDMNKVQTITPKDD